MENSNVVPIPNFNEAVTGELGTLEVSEPKKERSMAAVIIGGIAAGVAGTAVDWFLRSYAPGYSSKVRNLVMRAGISLVAGTVGTVVGTDVSNQVDETADIVKRYREELAKRDKETANE